MSIVRRLTLAILPFLCLLTRTVAQDTAVQVPALQPEVQTAPWAVKWWMPRHEQKLKELDALEKVDLLMIGDSITHGWEERGKTVWDKYYFLQDDGTLSKSIMPDLLHPNAKGHEIWAEAMEPTLVKLLGENHVRTVRVLTIGNSFAQNACRFLTDIADSDGSVRIVIGTANIGGCTLEKHAVLAAQSQSDSSVKPYQDKRSQRETNFSLQEYLQVKKWDYVTLQQMSALSYKPKSFHPHIKRLSAIVREHAPDAKILIHQTWAYRPDSPLLEQDNLSQQEMYERLNQAYAAVAKKLGSRIIPVGTAFQIVREIEGRQVLVRDPDFDFENPVYPNLPRQTNSLVVGWHWTKKDGKPRLALDYKHGNTHGCFLAGLVWYEALTGNDARETSYVPKGVDQRAAAFYRRVAHLTVVGPRPVAASLSRNEPGRTRTRRIHP